MMRYLLAGGVVAAAAAFSAPAAHADPVCQTVSVNRPPMAPVTKCVEGWPWGTTCDSGGTGIPQLDITWVVCVPNPIGQP